jgi:hypothetical protein
VREFGGRQSQGESLARPVAIGAPAYDGADFFDANLVCLARRAFRDFRALIHELASRSSGCELAVSTTVLTGRDLQLEAPIPPPVRLDADSARHSIRTLFGSYPDRYYGLWDRETVRTAIRTLVPATRFSMAPSGDKNRIAVPITIGVPVFNGADLLDESLACLARQTFRDFRVMVFDNASTDATPEIARAWAARDSRFEHVRNAENIGVLANFRAALLAADSPWFMWRADDDLSSGDYLEVLYRVAMASPGCKLAVCNVASCDVDGGRRRLTEAPDALDPATTTGRLRMLFAYHLSWFYGLWDRATLAESCLPVFQHFPFAYASDHATLYGPIIDGVVRTTTKTEFIQRNRRPTARTRMGFAAMVAARLALHRELHRIRAERNLALGLRASLIAIEPFYLERTAPSLLKTARTGLRELLGLTGSNKVGRHFEKVR